jgi:hypothetical protein
MGPAAAAAGKRAASPTASYAEDEANDDDEGDSDDAECVAPTKKKAKTPATSAGPKRTPVTSKAATAEAKAAAASLKGIVAKLVVLDRQQLSGVLQALLETGAVSPEKIESLLPAPDMSAYVKEGERLSAAIRRALPNSRFGSSTDHYGYKRCASANNACKKYIVDNAKLFKSAKQWQAAREYAVAMLPVARGMVEFQVPGDCKARNSAIDNLTSLKAEAESKLGMPSSPKPKNSPTSKASASEKEAPLVAV